MAIYRGTYGEATREASANDIALNALNAKNSADAAAASAAEAAATAQQIEDTANDLGVVADNIDSINAVGLDLTGQPIVLDYGTLEPPSNPASPAGVLGAIYDSLDEIGLVAAVDDEIAVVANNLDDLLNIADSAEQISTSLATIEQARDDALAAQTAAETAETNAASSAASASTSATNAASSASSASTSATNASTSASTASTAATNAASSASSASTSASSATTSASTASTAATNASNSATSASTSASNAATSETNAASSASSASTSATNAASSASAASTSATNAASSASSASTSASNAATSESNAAASEAAAAASYDSFDDRYLGAKSSAPTLDNDGNSLLTGALYWNSTSNGLFIWTGSEWSAAAFDVGTALFDADIGVTVQANLVSGTNIKTINSTSLLGSGDITTGDVTLTGTQTLTNKTITGTKETKVTMSANDLDMSAGNYFSKTILGTTTLTVSNVPSSGTAESLILDLTDGGSATITWWSGMKWAGGTAPSLTTSGRDVLGFFTYDGGTTWTGLVLGKDVK